MDFLINSLNLHIFLSFLVNFLITLSSLFFCFLFLLLLFFFFFLSLALYPGMADVGFYQ